MQAETGDRSPMKVYLPFFLIVSTTVVFGCLSAYVFFTKCPVFALLHARASKKKEKFFALFRHRLPSFIMEGPESGRPRGPKRAVTVAMFRCLGQGARPSSELAW